MQSMGRVVIVDDDFMVADGLEEILIDAGYLVCGIAGTIADAVQIAQKHRPNLGVVDLRLLHGEMGTDAVAALRRIGELRVLYATGTSNHPLLDLAKGDGCISKPYSAPSILSALRIVSEGLSRPCPIPFPQGFRLLGV
jgi:two-component system, response regulator PdtaR